MATSDPKKDYVMVAAIDFGTTFSGYGFSFTDSKTDIKCNKNWADAHGFWSYKTPTTVLLKGRDFKFSSFGYEAEEQYMDPEDEDTSVKNLYRHFKMILHKKTKLSTTKTTAWSTDGQITPAIEIFTHALRFLQDHMLKELSKQLTSPPDADMIRWVITVPAIWTEEAKQFMREAAFRVGVSNTVGSL